MLLWMPRCEIIMPCGFGTGADNRDRQQGPSDIRWVSEISAPSAIFTFSEYQGCFVWTFKVYFAFTCTLYHTYTVYCILLKSTIGTNMHYLVFSARNHGSQHLVLLLAAITVMFWSTYNRKSELRWDIWHCRPPGEDVSLAFQWNGRSISHFPTSSNYTNLSWLPWPWWQGVKIVTNPIYKTQTHSGGK